MSRRVAEWAAQHEAQVDAALKLLRGSAASGRASDFARTQLAGTECWLVFIRRAERVCVWKCSEAQSGAIVAARSTAGVTVRAGSATSLGDEFTVRPQALLIAAQERKRALRGVVAPAAAAALPAAAPAAAPGVIDLCDDSDEDEGAEHGAAAGGTPAKRQKTGAALATTTPARTAAASPAARAIMPAATVVPDAALAARVAGLEAAVAAAQRAQVASDARAAKMEAGQNAQRAALARLCAAAGSAVTANGAVAEAVRQLAQTFA